MEIQKEKNKGIQNTKKERLFSEWVAIRNTFNSSAHSFAGEAPFFVGWINVCGSVCLMFNENNLYKKKKDV